MALINCPECGKEISDRAKTCINCGCPLEDMNLGGTVRIKMPNNIVEGVIGLFSSRNCSVEDESGIILWNGLHGENAIFQIGTPMKIIVKLGSWCNPVSSMVEPRKKYALIQDMGMHMLATFRLTEVDIIDAD